MQSFISWIGGKKLLRTAIIEQFPEQSSFDRYIEVFGGAGWVLFAKDKYASIEVYNDIDSDLVNLYRCVKYHCAELQRELEWLTVSREMFFDAIAQLRAGGLTDIQRAARYYLLIKSSFGADRRSFGMRGKDLGAGIEYLTEIQRRLKRVTIEHKSFDNLIQVYDRPTALFYCDPPYVGTEKHYDNPFGEADHRLLNTCLKDIKGRFVLSYNDCDLVRELYKDFVIIPVQRTNSLVQATGSKFAEVIIKNF